jgi:hypothetical protein
MAARRVDPSCAYPSGLENEAGQDSGDIARAAIALWALRRTAARRPATGGGAC